LRITRREFCQSTAAVALTTALLGASSLPELFDPAFAAGEKVPEIELMAPEALPDMVMGDAKAPVTIIEYASMTCPHCAHFHETTYPELKKKYIDTGKVRFIFREFPLDPIAAGASMLARCADKDKFFPMIETLFQLQRQWAVEKPIPPLMAIAKQAGFTEQSFNACISNKKMLDQIQAEQKRASDKFGVNSTPTIFVNGKKQNGAVSIEDLSKVIDPLLPKS
jgi:protein-disulfide isomerase